MGVDARRPLAEFKRALSSINGAVYANADDILSRVHAVCTEMLHDRGERITAACSAETMDRHVDQLAPVMSSVDESGRSTGVIFYTEDRVPIRLVRGLSDAFDKYIIVSLMGATCFTKKQGSTSIEYMRYADLLVNITRHQCVPAHERYTGPQHYASSDYPKLLQSDPIARYYGYQAGDLVKITRRFDTYGTTDYIRIVVAG